MLTYMLTQAPPPRCLFLKVAIFSLLVANNGFCWSVYHGGVVNDRKVLIHQVKLILPQQD